MPKYLRQLRDAYCSAPPLPTSTLRPPRLSRDVEVRRPRAPIVEVKREVGSSIESAEFVIDEEFNVKPPKIDPRQLQRSIAALAIAPPLASESSSASGDAGAPGPSNWGVRSPPLNRIPGGTSAQRTRLDAEAAQRAPRPGHEWLSASPRSRSGRQK